MHLTLKILPKQAEFLQSKAKTTIFRGGIGSGKTHVLCLGAINRALVGRRVCITSFSYPLLRDACLTTMRRILSENEIPFDFAKQEMTMSIGSGKVFFRSGDDPDSLRGPEYHDGFIDEARNFDNDYIYQVLVGRLRLSDDGQVFIATSPHGKDWVYNLSTSKGCQLITQHTGENTFNPKSYVETLRDVYGGDYYRQEVEAAILDSDLSIFKREWWKYYDVLPMEKPVRTVQSWDTAFKIKRTSDDSACTTWKQFRNGIYLIDGLAEKMEYPTLKETVKISASVHLPDAILIEDKASGQSLIPDLKAETTLPILPVEVETDKATRAHSATPMIQAGNVYLPRNHPFTYRLVQQCADFNPAGKGHDDIVDTVTQFINWLKRQANGAPVITTRHEEVAFANLPRAPMSRQEPTIARPKARNLLRGY